MAEAFTPKWQGYLVTGIVDAAKLQADLDACFQAGQLAGLNIEPARVFTAAGNVRKKVEVWNQNRTIATPDTGCQQPGNVSDAAYIQNYEGDPDDLRIAGGFQTIVRNNGSSAVIVRSLVGGGELGPPTEEIPLFGLEVPPAGADYLDGGTKCSKVLRTINGVAGPNLQIRSDYGVLIGNHPELNRVVVAVNGEGLNFCPDVTDPEQVQCLPSSKENCGPIAGEEPDCPGAPDVRAGFTSTTPPGNPNLQPAISPTLTRPSTNLSNIYGTCKYQRESAQWTLIDDNSRANCQCVPPTTYGYLGQIRVLSAIPLPDEPPLYVRNPYFADGTLRWSVTGLHTVVDSDVSTKFEGSSYLEFTGELSQILIPLKAGKYRLQFLYETDAQINYEVFDARYSLVHITGQLDSLLDNQIWSEFATVPGDTDINIKLTTTGTARVTEIALVQWNQV